MNVSDSAVDIKLADIDVRFAVGGILAVYLKQKKVSDLQPFAFRKLCASMLSAIFKNARKKPT